MRTRVKLHIVLLSAAALVDLYSDVDGAHFKFEQVGGVLPIEGYEALVSGS